MTVVPAGQLTSAEVRARFLDRGELVPERRAAPPGVGWRMLADLGVADELAARSRAQSTRTAYGRHVEAWLQWAELREVCPLPADPAMVAAFLVDYTFAFDENREVLRDEAGRPLGRVTAQTTGQRLAAINKLHEMAGRPKPGADPRLADIMRGLRRTLGTRPVRAKAALTWNLVERMVDAPVPAAVVGLRRKLLLALRDATGATAGQLTRLEWAGVELGDGYAHVSLPATRAGGKPTAVRLSSRDTTGRAAIRLLSAWLERTSGWPGTLVIKDQAGHGLSRQGVHKFLTQRAGEVSQPEPGRDARDMRDRALLLVGWTMAQRRSNLSSLNWDDVGPDSSGGWLMFLQRSKTDQEGRGRTVCVPRAPKDSGMADPAQALADWLAVVRETLGFDPRSVRGVPVFCRVDQRGHLARNGESLARLSGAAINEIVQQYASAAGLEAYLSAAGYPIVPGANPFGSHSLRAGFLTECGERGVPLELAMGQSGHESIQVAKGYFRPARGVSALAATTLFGAIAARDTEPDQPLAPLASESGRRRQGPVAIDWDASAG